MTNSVLASDTGKRLTVHYRTSKFTTAPARTFCPGGGHCVTIVLAGEGCGGGVGPGGAALGVAVLSAAGGGAMLTVPSLKPASCSVRLALPKGCPRKLGITYADGSAATVTSKLVLGAATWLACAGGLCASTWSASVPGNCISAVEATSSPRRWIFHSAARSLCLVTSGITTRCGPRLRATRTCHPRRTFVPGGGIWVMILPSGICGL